MQNHFETFRTSAQRAPLAALDVLVSEMYGALSAGFISDEQAASIEAIVTGRRAEQAPAQSLGAALVRTSIFPKRRRQRSPERTVLVELRRKVGGSGAMPAALHSRFTEGERAVLSIVAHEVAARGNCDLCIDAIAAKAGVCRRLVQSALRLAEGDALLTITRRPQRGRKSLTNVVRIISREWLAWLARGPRRSGCKTQHPMNTGRQNKRRLNPSEAVKEAAEGVSRDSSGKVRRANGRG